ncbi:hypothetical protein GF336_02850 [Candidatus Woesearchaeota archaeon]|nr:hypothetical protein [Candidatus Woesearchaeota archaeon]
MAKMPEAMEREERAYNNIKCVLEFYKHCPLTDKKEKQMYLGERIFDKGRAKGRDFQSITHIRCFGCGKNYSIEEKTKPDKNI